MTSGFIRLRSKGKTNKRTCETTNAFDDSFRPTREEWLTAN